MVILVVLTLESFYFWLDDVANATMRHCVAFEYTNDAKKNDLNIYFHMEPDENRPEVRKQWIYAMNLRKIDR